MSSQGLLFAEATIAETGLWCELDDGIDRARWVRLCRLLGNLTPAQFQKLKNVFIPTRQSEKSL
mgnify:CR=1 FL=1